MTASTAVILALTATPGLSLTPEELWGQWQDFLTSSGYEVSVDTGGSGSELILDNLTLTREIQTPDQSGTVAANLGQYTMTGQGDGSVLITMPDSQPIVIDVTAEGEPPVQVTLEQTAAAFEMRAQGSLEDTQYSYSGDSYGLALTSVVEDGTPIELGTAGMLLSAIAGTTDIKTDTAYEIEQQFTAETMTYTLDITEPPTEGTGHVVAAGMLSGIRSTGGGTIPIGVDSSDFAALAAAGFDVSGALSFESSAGENAFTDGDQSVNLKTRSGGGQYTFGLDGARVTYQATGQDLGMEISGSEVPFPLNLEATEAGFQISLPLAKSEEAQDFEMSFTLAGVTLPDQLWAMADPEGRLPRDPLTLQLAVSGTGELFVDLTNEAQMQQLAETGGTPGQVETLKVETLTIEGLGAQIDATADLTVDNDTPSPMGQGPNVYGTANIHLVGVQALLQTLAQMGLIPPAQAMMGAGMISQLGRQVSGPDDLEADITMDQQGALTINGVPFPPR
ncbi:DUF2125 domain-containing protein [Pseudooceanicola sp. LIPI14-2-Ac024]|uniref:DUF2125 domain-containing protein n=1 Tax=Pseudooceanicola sp. LIPI14-2-Ac024 TaxID=3344875 RepID=UPI0035D08E18